MSDKPIVTLEEMRNKNHRSMKDILDEGGITDEYLKEKLKNELDAEEMKVFNDKGKIIYSNGLVAWEIRQRARQDAHKLRGDYPAEKHEIDGDLTIELIDYGKKDDDKTK
jgi:hypothetical protein